MAASSALMNEIYDHFLVCKVCLEAYKGPKTLACQHTFCKACLVKHHEAEQERSHGYRYQVRSVSCPVCRKRTDLPIGGISKLSDNFLISNLCEVVDRRRSSKSKSTWDCDICRPMITSTGARSRTSKDSPAHFRCLDCSKMLCRRCADLHRRTKVTQDHGLFDVDLQDKDIHCRAHEAETVRFYCEQCEECICVLCTFQDHRDHEVYTFTEGVERHGHSLDTLLDRSRGRCGMLRQQIELIGKCETSIKATEDCIRETAMEWIRQIRQQERQILQELEEILNDKAREFINRKATLQETLQALENTCSLTEIVIKDRSVELLLLKNEISQKLNKLLGEGSVAPIPEVVTETVAFVPGTCFLGDLSFTGKTSDVVSNTGMQMGPITKVKRTEDRRSTCNIDVLTRSEHRGGRQVPSYLPDKSIACEPSEEHSPTALGHDFPVVGAGKNHTRQDNVFQQHKNTEQSQSCCHALNSRDEQRGLRCADIFEMTNGLVDASSAKTLDTSRRIVTRDSFTQSQTTELTNVGTMTNPVVTASKSVSTSNRGVSDKAVITEKLCLTDASTVTCRTDMLGVTANGETAEDQRSTSTLPEDTQDQVKNQVIQTFECSAKDLRFHNKMNWQHSKEIANGSTGVSYCEPDCIVPGSRCQGTDSINVDAYSSLAFTETDFDKTDKISFTNLNSHPTEFICVSCRNTFHATRQLVKSPTKLENTIVTTERSCSQASVPQQTNFAHRHNYSCIDRVLPLMCERGTNTNLGVYESESCNPRLQPIANNTTTGVLSEKNKEFSELLPHLTETGTHKTGIDGNCKSSCITSAKDNSERSNTMSSFKSETGPITVLHDARNSQVGQPPSVGSPLLQTKSDKSTTTLGLTATGHEQGIPRRSMKVTLSRGTMTDGQLRSEAVTHQQESPKSSVDRASSPVRFKGVDKAVSANRGEIAEPVDTFQTPGKHTKLLKSITNGPKLDSICEGSDESSPEQDECTSSSSIPLPTRQRFTSKSISVDHRNPAVLTHKERFVPSFGSKPHGRPTSSMFSIEGRKSACSILWKVEMGTNTSAVELHDKATGTDSGMLDTKMAECINKLKTVTQRLETKQTQSALTCSSTSKESAEMTTSASSVEATLAATAIAVNQAVGSISQASPKPKPRHRTTTPSMRKQRQPTSNCPDSSLSESSDQEEETRPSMTYLSRTSKRPAALARKQRVSDVSELLRGASLSSTKLLDSPRINRKPRHRPSNQRND